MQYPQDVDNIFTTPSLLITYYKIDRVKVVLANSQEFLVLETKIIAPTCAGMKNICT